MKKKTTGIILLSVFLLMIIAGAVFFTYKYCTRTMIRISNTSGASHIVIRSGGKEIFSQTAIRGGWQLCRAETSLNRLTLQISPPETGKARITYEMPEISSRLLDLKGEGKKRFLVLANVICPHVPEQAVFYFFDAEDNFSFYGTREYIGELGATFPLPNPELIFNTYAETGYWEDAGGAFISIKNQLAKDGNRFISNGKADFKQLYLKYRSLKQQLEKRHHDHRITAQLVLFSVWSDLFTYDNGWRFARRFASGLGYNQKTVEAALQNFKETLRLLDEADAIRKFNPGFRL